MNVQLTDLRRQILDGSVNYGEIRKFVKEEMSEKIANIHQLDIPIDKKNCFSICKNISQELETIYHKINALEEPKKKNKRGKDEQNKGAV